MKSEQAVLPDELTDCCQSSREGQTDARQSLCKQGTAFYEDGIVWRGGGEAFLVHGPV